MKKILFPLFLLAAALNLQSCSEDFEVAAPYRPVTVVYGMMDMRDTAHYIRIQRTFLDENKNAFDMAKVSDSNFYKESDLDVVIKEYSGGSMVGSPVALQRVDMTAEGYPKNGGTFFTSPNYAYKFKSALNPAHTYRLVINNKVNNMMDSAEIRIVDANKLALFGGDSVQRAVKFASVTNGEKTYFTLDQAVVGTVDYVEVLVRFKWDEIETATGNVTKDSADFPFATVSGDAIKQLKIETESARMLNFLINAMGNAAPGYQRKMDSCDVFLYGYGREYYDYVTTTQIQSSGLTADQIKPVFTNIKGKDVFGLFTSRTNKKYVRNAIDDATMKVLMTGAQTTGLKIVGRVFP